MAEMTPDNVTAFWWWFASIAEELGSDCKPAVLLEELDRRVTSLGAITWELGPGVTKPNALAISPGGSRELMPLCREIVSLAPDLTEWEFHPAKPPKQWSLRFSLDDGPATRHEIDANDWEYVLLQEPDRTFDLVVCASNISHLSEDLRQVAAEVTVDGILGEGLRLEQITEIEVIAAFSEMHRGKATNIKHLRDHLLSLGP